MKKIYLFICILLIVLMCPNQSYSSDEKIGFINLQEIIQKSNAGKKAAEEFKTIFEQKQTSVKVMDNEVRELKNELDKQGSVMTTSARSYKEAVYQRKLSDYQLLVNSTNKELQRRDQEYSQKLIPQILKIVRKIGNEEKYTIILDISTMPLPAFSKDKDISIRIIREFNRYSGTNTEPDINDIHKNLSATFTDDKIGFINMQEIIQKSNNGKKAAEEFKKISDQKQASVKAMENEVQELKDELDKQGSVMTASARSYREAVYQRKLSDYQLLVDSTNKELQKRDQEYSQKLIPQILKIVKRIQEEEKYTVILDISTMTPAFASSSKDKDITNRIVMEYDQYPIADSWSGDNATIKAENKVDSAPQKIAQTAEAKKHKRQTALDSTPPVIEITSPKVLRGVKLTARDSSITVTGTVTDAKGVANVTVNEETATLDEEGNFSAEILLKVGENKIVVAATNIHKNTATETFTLVRESGQVAKAKPEAAQLSAGIGGGKYYALIIGNNNYRHLSRLQTAVKDAKEIEKILKESYGFRCKLLLNATRKEILSSINEYRVKLSERDNLLIYYAGHGEFDRSAEKAYWLPVDALRDDPTDWIIADDITSSIKRLSSKHVLIVSDSCYSGTLTRSAQTRLINTGERNEFLKKMAHRPSRTLIASGGNEPVADGGGSGHSIFADNFIKALREIDNPVFTADELFYQYIRSRVAGRSDQVPEYSELRNSGHDGGDFIFMRSK